ncbi:MAG TPA: hypothetical protein VF746_21580 [Longimicrobium sp.]|jgi:hypothetical protein
MRPLRFPTLLLPAALALALAACAEDPAGLSPDDAQVRRVVVPACVEFGPPPALGTVYGAPVATPINAVVFVENGVRVSVHRFFTAGGAFYNLMRIENAFGGFGAGQIARANNINIGFDYTGVGFAVNAVRLEWRDAGGVENLQVNASGTFIGELDTPPAALGGVGVSSSSFAIPGGDQGTTTLTGPVSRFRVGGQEFWIDRVCAFP